MPNEQNPKNPNQPGGKDRDMQRPPQRQPPRREGDPKRRDSGNMPKEQKSPNPRQG
jgi:hypothetical protein